MGNNSFVVGTVNKGNLFDIRNLSEYKAIGEDEATDKLVEYLKQKYNEYMSGETTKITRNMVELIVKYVYPDILIKYLESDDKDRLGISSDYSGRNIGGLYVIMPHKGKWLCRCQCGEIVTINPYYLQKLAYKRKTRPCLHGKASKKFIDLTGKTIGEWYVVKYLCSRLWLCQCSCGNLGVVEGYSLYTEASKSCGHTNTKDITGNTYNDLTVLRYLGNKKYECRCKCGNITEVFRNNLLTSNTRSCGCKTRDYMIETNMARYGENNSRRIGNPREKWQIEVMLSKENLYDFLIKFKDQNERIPTIGELAVKLDVRREAVIANLKKFGIYNQEYVDIENSSFRSDTEREIRGILRVMCKGLNYDINYSERRALHGIEIDIFIPQANLGIEYNGSYWHNEFQKEPKYHLNKTIEAIKHNICLVHLFDYEYFTDIDKDIAIRFLKSRVYDQIKINVEDCTIVSLGEDKEKKKKNFLDNNYILRHKTDYSLNWYNYAVYHNNDIVGTMSLYRSPYGTSDYFINCVCYKPGISVDATERMINKFIRKYNPSSIGAYYDLSKALDNYFKDIKGFKKLCMEDPSVMYVSTGKKHALAQFEVSKIAKENNVSTEDVVKQLLNNKYYPVYDCGRLYYRWNKPKDDLDAH